MEGLEKHYFGRGNTAAGLYSLYDSTLNGLGTIFVINGRTGSGTSRILSELADAWKNNGWTKHFIHDPLNNERLEGIILEEARIGIIDGNAWSADPILEGTDICIIDTAEALRGELLEEAKAETAESEREIASLYTQAYNSFLRTLRIHDEWEKFYIENLDRDSANRISSEFADEYLIPITTQKARITRRFLGAATWQGAVDYVPNLTEPLRTRIFVKGRPGSGKSTMFKKLAKEAEARGIDTEIYHCGFDPNSLDMLIFPELSLAIFDSTAPHEHFPSREGDSILDVYELAIKEGTDEAYAEEIAEIRSRYQSSMKHSISVLADVKRIRDEVWEAYDAAIDPAALRAIAGQIIQQVETLTNSSVISEI
ncbi:hypothetical protein [Paenibacillus sp.]|jgi:fructose-specific component phosphotransferase system IIB-like protein|uniref:hypothetical protein n=1 Tax=Paenibacillus sp. TaxID=58172 RepID=UPI0028298F2D|nr:hypothetical protein [Paenibacillus sp.]MDR0267556.1 hypothetical protein [Paenibacillus sp.]